MCEPAFHQMMKCGYNNWVLPYFGYRYVFYDGPPFATGLPHYGHILAGTVKDVVTRWAHQSGFYVERRFGWDCHGLPVVRMLLYLLVLTQLIWKLELCVQLDIFDNFSVVSRNTKLTKHSTSKVPRMLQKWGLKTIMRNAEKLLWDMLQNGRLVARQHVKI